MRKNQYLKMIKLNRFILIFIITPFFSKCQQKHYTKLGSEGGPAFMTLYSNNSYEYLWYRYYDLGPIDDTISHSGTWKESGDTLILNSYNKPSNYEFLKIEREEVINDNDSTIIMIKSFDTTPFLFYAPKQIRVNDRYYSITLLDEFSIRFAIPRSEVKYIVIPGYPLYYPKSKKSNYFQFAIKELTSKKFEYSGGTYFLNEKFLTRGDTLYQLWNNEVQLTFLKDK